MGGVAISRSTRGRLGAKRPECAAQELLPGRGCRGGWEAAGVPGPHRGEPTAPQHMPPVERGLGRERRLSSRCPHS